MIQNSSYFCIGKHIQINTTFNSYHYEENLTIRICLAVCNGNDGTKPHGFDAGIF